MARSGLQLLAGSDWKLLMKSVQDKIDAHLARHGEDIKRLKENVAELTLDFGRRGYGSILEGMLVPRLKPWVGQKKGYNTALSEDRFWMIKQIEGVAPEGIAVEMGVYDGGVSNFFLDRARPTICYDTFEGISGSSSADLHKDGDYTSSSKTEKHLRSRGAIIRKGRIPETLSAEMGEIAIAHIDLDVKEPTKHALEFCYERLAKGGFIIMDDYGMATTPGVKEAVDDFPLGIKLYIPTGQMIIMKGKTDASS